MFYCLTALLLIQSKTIVHFSSPTFNIQQKRNVLITIATLIAIWHVAVSIVYGTARLVLRGHSEKAYVSKHIKDQGNIYKGTTRTQLT